MDTPNTPVKVPNCPIHHRPMILVCPSCRASKGGKSRSFAKIRAAKVRERKKKVARLRAEGKDDYKIRQTLGFWPDDVEKVENTSLRRK